MKIENDDRLRQELRLAQLEIKVLREQLLKSVQEAQRTQEKIQEPTERAMPRSPEKLVVVPMVPNDSPAPNGLPALAPAGRNPRVLCVEDSEPNFRLLENILRDDVATGSFSTEDAIRNAPEREGAFIVVPAILAG
jgi:PleD family two-component response regulator